MCCVISGKAVQGGIAISVWACWLIVFQFLYMLEDCTLAVNHCILESSRVAAQPHQGTASFGLSRR